MEDKQEYIRRLQADLQATEDRYETLLSQFMQADTNAALRSALEEIPYILEPPAVRKAVDLFRNKQLEVAIRVLAMQKVIGVLSDDAEYIASCLAVLGDSTEPASLRKSVLLQLKALSFSSKVFVALRSDFMGILRNMLDDSNRELRGMAAEQLAIYKDEVVQNRLLNGLQGTEKPVVSQAKAIQLLARDAHANYYPIVREILQNPKTNKLSKVEAIHALAFDQESKPLLAKLFGDKRQSNEVRMSSATAFQAAHPDDFVELAKPAVLDEKEKKEIRAVSLNALMHHRDVNAVFNDEQFTEKVKKIKSQKAAKELKKLSGQYLKNASRHRKNNP